MIPDLHSLAGQYLPVTINGVSFAMTPGTSVGRLLTAVLSPVLDKTFVSFEPGGTLVIAFPVPQVTVSFFLAVSGSASVDIEAGTGLKPVLNTTITLGSALRKYPDWGGSSGSVTITASTNDLPFTELRITPTTPAYVLMSDLACFASLCSGLGTPAPT